MTVSSGHSRGVWKLRISPRRLTACAGRPASSRPSNLIVPESGVSNPLTRLTSVLFPAPLGPIRPVRDPSATVIEAPSTARSPPKYLLTLDTSSKGALASIMRGAVGGDGGGGYFGGRTRTLVPGPRFGE